MFESEEEGRYVCSDEGVVKLLGTGKSPLELKTLGGDSKGIVLVDESRGLIFRRRHQ